MEAQFQEALNKFCRNGQSQSLDDLRSELLRSGDESILDFIRLKNHLLHASTDFKNNCVIDNSAVDESDILRLKWAKDYKSSNLPERPRPISHEIPTNGVNEQVDNVALPPSTSCGLAFMDGKSPCAMKVDNFLDDEVDGNDDSMTSTYIPISMRSSLSNEGMTTDHPHVETPNAQITLKDELLMNFLLDLRSEQEDSAETVFRSHELKLPLEKMGITYGAQRCITTSADIFLEHYISQTGSGRDVNFLSDIILDEGEKDVDDDTLCDHQHGEGGDSSLPHRAQMMFQISETLPGAGERDIVDVEAFVALLK